MRVALAADERTGGAGGVGGEGGRRGPEPGLHRAPAGGGRGDRGRAPGGAGRRRAPGGAGAGAGGGAARDVAEGRAEQGIVCCWTGTGASIAANKVPGVRAALCADAPPADGARRWNDANVLAVSLRTMSAAVLSEVLDAWFAGAPSADADDRANVEHLDAI